MIQFFFGKELKSCLQSFLRAISRACQVFTHRNKTAARDAAFHWSNQSFGRIRDSRYSQITNGTE